MTACGIPSASSSNAVKRAPWSSGRVSSTQTCDTPPRSAAARIAPDRRAVAAGREPAGVAVGQDPGRRRHELRRVGAHRDAARDLVLVDPPRALGRRVGPHLVERPAEVDGRRARGGERLVGGVDVLRPASRRAPGRTRRRRRSPAPRARRATGSPRRAPPHRVQRSSTTSSGSRRWSRTTTASSSSRTMRSGSRSRSVGLTHVTPRYVPSSHEARYFACSSVSWSIEMPIVASLSRAISSSISFGTT